MKLLIGLFVVVLAFHTSLATDTIYGESDNVVKRSYFLVSTPKVWMSSVESVCLVLFRAISLPNAIINVNVESMTSGEVFVQKSYPLNSLSECVEIPVYNIRSSRALVKVQLADIVNETLVVKIKPSTGITLIETSKPIYRTNEYLQFRVIALNDWLRPIDEQFSRIVVENGNSVTVMQWNDVKTQNGIVSLQMPISENNVMGVWKIKAYSAQSIVTDKIFKVFDYETPSILINIDTPNYVLSNQENAINSKICVTNNYGEALNGQLYGVVSYFRFNFNKPESLIRTALPVVSFAENINGCYNLVLQSTQLNWTSTKYSQLSLKISVQFRDQSTGFNEEKYGEIPLVQNPLNLIFPSVNLMKQYFKPGLPYFGYLVVSSPDYSYAADERVNVCYETRQVPWISGSVPQICEQMVSDNDGLIHFTIPPVPTLNNTFAVKQIVVTAQSVKYADIRNELVLEPAYSSSNEYITLRPKVYRNYCKNSVEFDVLFNRPLASAEYQNIYYQILGSGVIHSPQIISLKPSHRWTNHDERYMIGSRLCENCDIPVAKMTVTLPQSPLNNNIVNRILLYYLDLKGNIIADSNVFLTTCLDHSQHLTRINVNPAVDRSYVELSVQSHPGSVCSVRVSQNKPYSSVKKLNEFIEKFNFQRQELSVRDNCELFYELKKRQSQAPYDASYGLQDTNTPYEPVLNFGDAWDSFNGIGLLVSSNAGLDNCPCEWDLYDTEVLAQLKAKRNTQLNSMNRRAQKFVRIQMQELEKSLLNEILYWDVLNMENKPNLQRISHPLISTTDQLHSDALCVSQQHGITYTRNHYKPQLDDKSLRLLVDAPQTARLGETLVYKVYTRKAQSSCYPIQIELENSSRYKLVSGQLVRPFCFCGTQSQPFQFRVQPEYVGDIDVKISAINPLSLGVYNASYYCGIEQLQEQLPQLLLPQTITKRLTVGPQRVVSQNINSHVICNNNHNNGINSELVKHELPDYVLNSQNTQISSDIVTPVVSYLRWKRSNGLHNNNAFDTLSTFAATYYLYEYMNNHLENNRQQYIWNELQDELSKSYQTLINYQLNDGSYSLSYSKSSASGDIALSAAVFKVLSQSRRRLNYIQDSDSLRTLRWIYSQQLENGCFNAENSHHRRQQNIWPLNLDNNYDLTGYVIVSLLDAGLDFDSPPLMNAYQCFLNNTLIFTDDIKAHILSTAFYAYIQALNGNEQQLSQIMSKISAHRDYIYNENSAYSSEILSYLGLTYQLANDRSDAINIGQLLLRQPKVWQTPINCYAAIKLWPIIKINDTTLQVYGQNDALVSTLALNEAHSLAGNQRIAMRNNGCVLISTSDAMNKTFTAKTKYFEVDINNLERGYSSCRKRVINLCIKQKEQRTVLNPVVNVQLISGYQIDRKLMKKMIDRDVISSYKTVNGELIIFLQKLAVSNSGGEKSECVAIPLIQREDISGAIHGLITVYDYYNDDINDVIQYTLPQQCNIELEDEKSHHYYGGEAVRVARHDHNSVNKIDQSVYDNVNSI